MSSTDNFRALALTVDACPHIFGTAGCPSVVAPPPGFTIDYHDWPWGASVQVGALEPVAGTIREELATSDGQLSVSGLDFTINTGHEIEGGLYDGELLLRLFTRKRSRIAQAALASDFEAGDATLTLASAAGFPSGTFVVWCEREAFLVSRSGTTLTVVTVLPLLGYGYFGSRPEDHRLDPARGYAPVVWAEFPGVAKRRCTLWAVDANGYATALWRGVVSQPRAHENGSQYVLSATSAWGSAKDTKPGGKVGAVTLGGYYLPGLGTPAGFNWSALSVQIVFPSPTDVISSTAQGTEPERTCASLEELVGVVQQRLRANLDGAGRTTTAVLLSVSAAGGIDLTAIGPDAELLGANILGAVATPVVVGTRTSSGGTARVVATVPPESIVGAYLQMRRGAVTRTTRVVLDSTRDFPASFARETVASPTGLVTYARVLLGEFDHETYGERYSLVFRPDSVDAGESSAEGLFELVPRRSTVRPFSAGERATSILRPQRLRLADAITADHWALAIDYALTSWTTARRAAIDARDWARDAAGRVIAATDGISSLSRVRWYLDGERPFGELVTSQCRLFGCAVGIGPDARMRLAAIRPPLPTDEVAATITSAELLENPRYETLDASLRTSASLKSGDATVGAADLDAEARYGATAPIELETVGAPEGFTDEALNPGDAALQLLRFVLGLWAGPVTLHHLVVSATDYAGSVFLGDAVQFDSFIAPDGDGGYGLEGARGVVLSKEYAVTGDDRLTLGVLVFEDADRLAAIAPAWRVEAIDGATLTVAIDYLSGSATDYSGSDAAGYRFAADAPHDGGTSWVQVGMVLRLVTLADTTTLGGLVVAAVDPATRAITFEAPVSMTPTDWVALLAANTIVDLVLDNYADVGEGERAFAYVASETANVIDGTTDAPNRWAP